MDERNLNPIEQALEGEVVKVIKEVGLPDMIMAAILFVGVGGASAIMYIKHVLENK